MHRIKNGCIKTSSPTKCTSEARCIQTLCGQRTYRVHSRNLSWATRVSNGLMRGILRDTGGRYLLRQDSSLSKHRPMASMTGCTTKDSTSMPQSEVKKTYRVLHDLFWPGLAQNNSTHRIGSSRCSLRCLSQVRASVKNSFTSRREMEIATRHLF